MNGFSTAPLAPPLLLIPIPGSDPDDDVEFAVLEGPRQRLTALLGRMTAVRDRVRSDPSLLAESRKDFGSVDVYEGRAMDEVTDVDVLGAYSALRQGVQPISGAFDLPRQFRMRVFGTTLEVDPNGVRWDLQVDGSHYRTVRLGESVLLHGLVASAPSLEVPGIVRRLVACDPAAGADLLFNGVNLPGSRRTRDVVPLLRADDLVPLLESSDRAIRERATGIVGRLGGPNPPGRTR